MGLNIAYNIIQKHRGTIDVESEEGKGTTFRIRIPVDLKLDCRLRRNSSDTSIDS